MHKRDVKYLGDILDCIERYPEIIERYQKPLNHIWGISEILQYEANVNFLEFLSGIEDKKKHQVILDTFLKYPDAFKWRVLAALKGQMSLDADIRTLDKYAVELMVAFAKYEHIKYINWTVNYRSHKVTLEEMQQDVSALSTLTQSVVYGHDPYFGKFVRPEDPDEEVKTINFIYKNQNRIEFHAIVSFRHDQGDTFWHTKRAIEKKWLEYSMRKYGRQLKFVNID